MNKEGVIVPKPTLDRRQALRILGASTVASTLSGPIRGLHRLVPPPDDGGDWQPRFFTAEECATVEELAECIIPATETPGARAALVHQYIDWKLADEGDERERETVRRGLVWLDGESRAQSGAAFRAAPPEQQTALLARLAAAADNVDPRGAELFRILKQRTVEGYYRSEVGMMQELAFAGNDYLDHFEGCTHEEHRSWSPDVESPASKGRG